MPPLEIGLGELSIVKQVRFYSLARHAFMDALRLLGIGPGSRVLLPSYICRDLLAPLHLLGAIPQWYYVASDLSPATPSAEWPVAQVVLVVDYFGFPQDLQPFLDYTARTGAVLIEDNAHGYLSRDDNGLWLGRRADVGLFSLRKTLRMPDGAALWVDTSRVSADLPQQHVFEGTGVSPNELTKTRLRNMPFVGEAAYRLMVTFARRLRKWRTGSETPISNPSAEKMIVELPNPWCGLLSSILGADSSVEIERRRKAYAECAKVGERLGAIPVFAALPPNCSPYAYAFRAEDAALAGMRCHAKKCGFDLVGWPDLPTEIVGKAPAYYCNVHLVNFLW